MSLLCDHKDPTAALFLSPAGAQGAGYKVLEQFSDRVKHVAVATRTRAGQVLGYVLLITYFDNRPTGPLTNSDLERL